ncbi:MAG: CopG family transcriptional regulator [Egibacteraceae bacterium]
MSQGKRLEVRLDPEARRRLEVVAADRGAGISEAVRQLIIEAYERTRALRRREAARRIGALELEDVPDPDELSEQLDATYASPDLR